MVFRMSNKNKKHKSVSCLVGFRHCILVRANPTSVVPSVTVVQMGVSFLNEKKKNTVCCHVSGTCITCAVQIGWKDIRRCPCKADAALVQLIWCEFKVKPAVH